MSASLEKQRAFFAQTAELMKNEPKFRAAFVFELMDWPPAITKQFTDMLVGEESSEPWVKKLEEWLLTTGLIRHEDGSPRPAWQAFLDSVEELARQGTAIRAKPEER